MPIVEGLDCIFVGLQNLPQGRQSLIRLYIEKQGGVTIDDCSRVARQVNAVLGVEVPTLGDYLLEVSSPGVDRLLFTPEQVNDCLGKLVSIRLIVPIEGKRNLKGQVVSVEGEMISLKLEDNTTIALSFADFAEARLVPEW